MRSDIQLAFENSKSENRPALLTYTVAADPNKKKEPSNFEFNCKTR